VASSDAAFAGLPAQTLSLSISDNEAPLLGRIGGQPLVDAFAHVRQRRFQPHAKGDQRGKDDSYDCEISFHP
jgi:hypothetical protein